MGQAHESKQYNYSNGSLFAETPSVDLRLGDPLNGKSQLLRTPPRRYIPDRRADELLGSRGRARTMPIESP